MFVSWDPWIVAPVVGVQIHFFDQVMFVTASLMLGTALSCVQGANAVSLPASSEHSHGEDSEWTAKRHPGDSRVVRVQLLGLLRSPSRLML